MTTGARIGPGPLSTADYYNGSTRGGGRVNQAVALKLRRLHTDHGYLTRAEIEAALGIDPPSGQWERPGQFGADGVLVRCCGEAAA